MTHRLCAPVLATLLLGISALISSCGSGVNLGAITSHCSNVANSFTSGSVSRMDYGYGQSNIPLSSSTTQVGQAEARRLYITACVLIGETEAAAAAAPPEGPKPGLRPCPEGRSVSYLMTFDAGGQPSVRLYFNTSQCDDLSAETSSGQVVDQGVLLYCLPGPDAVQRQEFYNALAKADGIPETLLYVESPSASASAVC